MARSSDKRVVIFSLLLVAVTLAFYNPIVRNHFIEFDDGTYILQNPEVQGGLTWDTLKWSFTTFHAGNWHPVTWLSHALDCRIFRLNPTGHHYVNLLLHAANAVLLFLLLRQATGLTWPSLLASALFALHPINVESVAWAAERKNVLSTLFFLLGLLAYDRYGRTGRRYLYWAVAIYFALGLMAKPQIVTLPFVLLLWDYWPLQRMFAGSTAADPPAAPAPRSFAFLVWEKWPLFLLAAADSVVTIMAQRSGAAIRTAQEISVRARYENVFVSYARYLGKLFWPSHLAVMYPHPGNSLTGMQVVGSTALVILISVLVLRSPNRRYLLMGWLWFLGTLVPMIGIITVGDQAMADRYAYIPFIGLFIAIVWCLAAFIAEHRIPAPWPGVAGALVVLILGCLTYRQLSYWRDDETLWRYTLSVTDRNYVAHDNLARVLAEEGRSNEAVVEFRAAEALHPYPLSQVLALALYELRVGHPQEAIEDCDSVLRVFTGSKNEDSQHKDAQNKDSHKDARNEDARSSLSPQNDTQLQSTAWSELGQAQMQLRDYEQSGNSFLNALRLNPENGGALVGSGLLALRHGRSAGAVGDLTLAVKVDSSDVNLLLLAHALRLAGNAPAANSALLQASKISADMRQAQIAAEQVLALAGLNP